MSRKVGTLMQEKTADIYSLFTPVEGFNTVYYGKIRNGKTYAATADILELLERGEVVIANWKIDFKGFDERDSFARALVRLIFGRSNFFSFNPENFHYIDTNDPNLITFLNKVVGAHIFIDEGQWIFNSHLKTDDVDKRRLILEGGHYCRSLNVITQRPMNILKDIRSQIHIWYKCEKRIAWGSFILFARWEIQEMKDDVPDEDPELKHPVKHYIAKAKVFNAYQTHGMRRADAVELNSSFDVYQTTFIDRLVLVLSFFIPERIFRAVDARSVRTQPKRTGSKKPWSIGDIT